jgi:hypothetical protein
MNGIKSALAMAPQWAKAALIVIPLLTAICAGAVEVQFGDANKDIPGGVQHDHAWKTYHRIRQFNRATLGLSVVAAVASSIAVATARRNEATTTHTV